MDQSQEKVMFDLDPDWLCLSNGIVDEQPVGSLQITANEMAKRMVYAWL